MTGETHFKIVIQAYQCQRWIVDCLKSVRQQKYLNWQAILHVEPSQDCTWDRVASYLDGIQDDRFLVVRNTERLLRPANDFDAIQRSNAADEDVIVFLDGDDLLNGPYVLSYLARLYGNSSLWVTWGSYMNSHSGERGLAAIPIPDSEGDEWKDKRAWRYSHLKTFRRFMLRGLKEEDLREKVTGAYYPMAWDMAMMFPIVEMAGREHGRFISKILYIYNTQNRMSNDKVSPVLSQILAQLVLSQAPYPCKTKEELCGS